jgi:hypothetical protein
MILGRGLRGTTGGGDISGKWAVVQQEAKADGNQTNGKLSK